MYGETLDFQCQHYNGSREEFYRQIYCKNWFPARVYITVTDADMSLPYIIW